MERSATEAGPSGNPFDEEEEEEGSNPFGEESPDDAAGNPFDDETVSDKDKEAEGSESSSIESEKTRHDAVSSAPPAFSNEQVARFLLDRNLLLTALEFYQELQEDGCELELLRDFFKKESARLEAMQLTHSDSWETSSTTSSSHSASNLSGQAATSNQIAQLLKEKENRILLLEYELRLSKEDVEGLRAEVKTLLEERRHHRESDSESAASSSEENATAAVGSQRLAEASELAAERPISILERKSLNYIVRNYLFNHGYKLTAITFSEEVDREQDLDVWDDRLGPIPPNMLAFYRYFYGSTHRKQFESMQSEIAQLKEQNKSLQTRLDKSEKRGAALEQQARDLQAANGLLEEKIVNIYKKQENEQKEREEREQVIKEAENEKLKHQQQMLLLQQQQQQQKENEDKKEEDNTNASQEKEEEKAEETKKEEKEKEHEEKRETENGTEQQQHAPLEGENGNCNNTSTIPTLLGEEDEDPFTIRRKKRSEAILRRSLADGMTNNDRIAKSVARIATLDKDNQSVVRIVAECLPHIVPGVLLNTREELIPVILCVIRHHPDGEVRGQMTQMLFNLIKVPDENQRRVIMDGCVALSRLVGPDRTGNELLPQCWEQIDNKNQERRVLVAESCGSLSPHVRAELRPSLILSILTQLLDDKSAAVRSATARNLAVLVSHFGRDESAKYAAVEELLIRLLRDPDADVTRTTQQVLLPIVVDWADSLGLLCDKLLTSILNATERAIKMERPKSVDLKRMEVALSSVESIVPRLYESVLLSSLVGKDALSLTDIDEEDRDDHDNRATEELQGMLMPDEEKVLTQHFNEFLEKNAPGDPEDAESHSLEKFKGNFSPAFDWLTSVCLQKCVDLLVQAKELKPSRKAQRIWAVIVTGVTKLIKTIGARMGTTFVTRALRPFFLRELQQSNSKKKAALLQVYVVGVLPSIDAGKEPAQLTSFMRDLIVDIGTDENGWDHSHVHLLIDCVATLSKESESIKTGLLGVCMDLLVHPSQRVKVVLVKVFDALANLLKPAEITARILPALITLGNDVEKSVRAASIQPLGNIAMNVSDVMILERVNGQLEAFMEDEAEDIQVELVNTFGNIIPSVRNQFRDSYILPKLVKITQRNHEMKGNDSRRINMVKCLFEAYRAFNGCLISQDIIRDGILPALQLLLKDSEPMGDPSYKKMISSTIADMQAAIGGGGGGSSTASSPSASSTTSSRASLDINKQPQQQDDGGNKSVSNNGNNSGQQAGADGEQQGGLFERWKRKGTSFSFKFGMDALAPSSAAAPNPPATEKEGS